MEDKLNKNIVEESKLSDVNGGLGVHAPTKPTMYAHHCPNCKKDYPVDVTVCPSCGAEMRDGVQY